MDHRGSRGAEAQVHSAEIMCPTPTLWIRYLEDDSWEQVLDPNRLRPREAGQAPPAAWESAPFVSLTYKSCPENMLPREDRRPLYKSQSRQIDNSINRREGWEDDQYSYPPLGKSPRKMGSRARSTGVGTSTGASGTFRQGEKRTRAKSSTHPPEQGPSPSPDMPRKTQRTETQPSEGRPSTNHTIQQLHHLNQQAQEQGRAASWRKQHD